MNDNNDNTAAGEIPAEIEVGGDVASPNVLVSPPAGAEQSNTDNAAAQVLRNVQNSGSVRSEIFFARSSTLSKWLVSTATVMVGCAVCTVLGAVLLLL